MAHVVHARLLVAAPDEAHAVGEGNARVAHGAHGVQGDQRRALVVHGAAAVDLAVLNLRAPGILRPAVAGGNHVQMAQNAQRLFAAAHGHVAGEAVHVPGLEAVLARGLQRQIQHLAVGLAEGGVGAGGLGQHAGHGDPALHIGEQLVLEREDDGIELFVIHGMNLHRA